MEHFFHTIQGWFDFANIYSDRVNAASEGAHFVELGTWKGKSASYMAVEIANSGKNIKFDCVDIWNGAGVPGEYENDASVKNQTLYEEFTKNMEPAAGYYTPVRAWTVEAADLYAPESLDFVFVDAGHDYDSVKADLHAWLPKVKPGGWIGGHDYSWAIGVKRAVNETFTNVSTNNTSWLYQVPKK
jgi:hypothetical protein